MGHNTNASIRWALLQRDSFASSDRPFEPPSTSINCSRSVQRFSEPPDVPRQVLLTAGIQNLGSCHPTSFNLCPGVPAAVLAVLARGVCEPPARDNDSRGRARIPCDQGRADITGLQRQVPFRAVLCRAQAHKNGFRKLRLRRSRRSSGSTATLGRARTAITGTPCTS